jgi:hypothetical protein
VHRTFVEVHLKKSSIGYAAKLDEVRNILARVRYISLYKITSIEKEDKTKMFSLKESSSYFD